MNTSHKLENNASADSNGLFPLKLLSINHPDWLRIWLMVSLVIPALIVRPQSILVLAIIVVTVVFWLIVFARSRHERPDNAFLYTCFLLLLLLPVDLSLWQLVLSVSFGVVLGEQIFGGRHDSFLSPVVVSLALLFYSFQLSDTNALVDSIPISWLIIPGLLLLAFRLLDWLALVGVFIGVVASLTVAFDSVDTALSFLRGMAYAPASVGICGLFIIGDTTLSARTQLGKLLSGVLVGILFFYLENGLSDYRQLVNALLLTAISIPLIDWLVVAGSYRSSQAVESGVAHAQE